jgi:hypothetical protein
MNLIKYYYNSIDLDYDVPNFELGLTCSKELADKILNKIVKCNFCVVASKSLSNLKGFHIEFYCTKKCDRCRLQFDDFRRFYMDEDRPKDCKNLIWNSKKGY